MWIDKLNDVLLDVCKYVLTAIIVSTLFTGLANEKEIYAIGGGIVIACLVGSYILHCRSEKEKNKRDKNKRRK